MSPSAASMSEAAPLIRSLGSPVSLPAVISASSRRVKVTGTAVRLAFHAGSNLIELAGGAEFLILVRDEVGVLLDENLARRPKVELFGMVAEEFAVDACPDQAAIGIDVHFGYAESRGREIFLLVHAASR